MRKNSKKIFCGIFLSMMLILAMGVGAFAYSADEQYYHNTFKKDDVTPGVYTPTSQKPSASPYVRPDEDTANTTYCLTKGTATQVVSSYIKTGDPWEHPFRYLVGVNSSNNIKMIYYPTSSTYNSYEVSGYWKA